MKSKELREQAEFCKPPDHDRGEMYDTDGYFYTEEEMEEYDNLICKEQRHECQIERNKRSICIHGEWYIHCEDILNAPKP